MVDKSSVFSKGSGGGTFEHHIQAAFLATLITRTSVPCVPGAEIQELAFQATRLGYATDDLFVRVQTAGSNHRLLLQAKHNLSFTSKDSVFQKVIKDFWDDFNNAAIFDPTLDKLVIVKGGLNDVQRNHVKVLLNWAKHKASSQDFLLEVNNIDAKAEQLKVFAAVLAQANNDVALSDDELWQFLRCVELLDYDFLNSGSVDLANVLGLIKLAQNEGAFTDALSVWQELLNIASSHNFNGGSITSESIKDLQVYRQFSLPKLEPSYRALGKLYSNGQAILLPIKNTVAGHQLPREELKSLITQACTTGQLTIITGAAGVGKSAVLRDWLTEQREGEALFVFRADQFNEPHLSHVFSKLGVNAELSDLFSCLALLPQKTIVIDSAEKLLEGEPDNAFRQLLAYLEGNTGPKINVILTSRRYAVDLLAHKFGLEKPHIVDVPLLTDSEMQQMRIAVPSLGSLLSNTNLASLLRSLKYLDLSASLVQRTGEDLSGVTLIGFKDKLWQHLVENVTVREHGMPFKRRKAFLGVAVQRAKQMTLFVEPEEVDEEALEALKNDDIIFSENEDYRYAPTHDVLEDLALVKHIDSNWQKSHDAAQFFNAVGGEPAMRRGFRLWVEDLLIEEPQEILQLIEQAQASSQIENYWLDEMLIAAFRSINCQSFFQRFEPHLLQNNAAFLWRCVHLIRTACRQSTSSAPADMLLYPTGSGWRYALVFIEKHFHDLQQGRPLIANFIVDWASNVSGVWSNLPTEAQQVKNMLLIWMEELESTVESKELGFEESLIKRLLIVLFKLVQLASAEVSGLLDRASTSRGKKDNYTVRSYYDQVVDLCLSGLYSAPLCKHVPDSVIQVANRKWRLKPRKKNKYHSHSYRYDREAEFGLDEHLGDDFPASIFKSPVRFLLRYSPIQGLAFVSDFINYCAGCYHQASRENNEPIEQYILTATDGSQIQQFGNDALWQAYRGTIVTSYLLQTVLMSVEHFLLELCKIKTDASRHLAQQYFMLLLQNSSSALITSVLASVAQAYPDELSIEWLPLLTAKQCFEWDLHRRLNERSALSPLDNKIPFAQQVTSEFNRLPHRQAYSRGLVDFVINYQMQQRANATQIREIIAAHYAELDDNNYVWHKMLNEMDLSKWEMEPVPDKLGVFEVRPTYDEKVQRGLEAYQIETAPQQKVHNASHWLHTVLENGEINQADFSKWEAVYNEFTHPDWVNHFMQRPAAAAVVGLRYFSDQISEEQRGWARSVLTDNIESKVFAARRYYETPDFPGKSSVLDTQLYLQSFSLLFDYTSDEEEKLQLMTLAVRAIASHIADHELDYLFEHFRDSMATRHPDSAKAIWRGVVGYARFAKEREYTYDSSDLDSVRTFHEAEVEFIESSLRNPSSVRIDELDLDFTNNSTWVLPKALAVIPYGTADEEQIKFMQILSRLVLQHADQPEDEDSPSRQRRKGRSKMDHQNIMRVWQYWSHVLFRNSFEVSSSILEILINGAVNHTRARRSYGQSSVEIVEHTLEYTILNLDKFVYNSKDEVQKQAATTTFWQLWNLLLQRLTELGTARLSKYVLLDTYWNDEATSWLPFKSSGDFYYRAVQQFGEIRLQSVVNVLATVGDQHFLPEGVTWVVNILQSNADTRTIWWNARTAQFIERLYQRHIARIKANRRLHQAFLWLLDQMVAAGVSSAYLIRENVIIYKLKPKHAS